MWNPQLTLCDAGFGSEHFVPSTPFTSAPSLLLCFHPSRLVPGWVFMSLCDSQLSAKDRNADFHSFFFKTQKHFFLCFAAPLNFSAVQRNVSACVCWYLCVHQRVTWIKKTDWWCDISLKRQPLCILQQQQQIQNFTSWTPQALSGNQQSVHNPTECLRMSKMAKISIPLLDIFFPDLFCWFIKE